MRTAITATAAAGAALWGALAFPPRPAPPPAAAPVAAPAEKHYVTAPDLIAAADAAGRAVLPPAADGRPTAVVFIKAGCPCSVEVEPLFGRLARAYAPAVRFVGFIDAGPDEAARYAADNAVAYPVEADPACDVARRAGARAGAYVALVRPDGTLESLWPGFSRDTTAALNRRLAALAGVPPAAVDDAITLPSVLTTGCPFDLESGGGPWPRRRTAATR